MEERNSLEILKELRTKLLYDPSWYKEAVAWCRERHLDWQLGKEYAIDPFSGQSSLAKDNLRYITTRWEYLVEKLNKEASRN